MQASAQFVQRVGLPRSGGLDADADQGPVPRRGDRVPGGYGKPGVGAEPQAGAAVLHGEREAAVEGQLPDRGVIVEEPERSVAFGAWLVSDAEASRAGRDGPARGYLDQLAGAGEGEGEMPVGGEEGVSAVPTRPESASTRLAERTYRCELCGLVTDRDVNAARNLLKLAASGAERVNACGGTVRPGLAGHVP
ncbi:MAG: Transposase, OrfB family, partial [Actinomycetia bacterium]|nr:Transposase, OrfB family [Actinomycetes bacterium]